MVWVALLRLRPSEAVGASAWQHPRPLTTEATTHRVVTLFLEGGNAP